MHVDKVVRNSLNLMSFTLHENEVNLVSTLRLRIPLICHKKFNQKNRRVNNYFAMHANIFARNYQTFKSR